jgi:hypothetical protein
LYDNTQQNASRTSIKRKKVTAKGIKIANTAPFYSANAIAGQKKAVV